LVDTIQDYLDKRDTLTRWRSSEDNVRLLTLDQRFNPVDDSVIYSFNDSDSELGWHQQTSSLNHRSWKFYGPGKPMAHRRPRNVGGPFITTKLEVDLPGRKSWNLLRLNTSGKTLYIVKGDLFPHIDVHRICQAIYNGSIRNHSEWVADDSLNQADLQLIGEQLMLSLVPTSAPFDAVTAIGEPISDGGFFGLPGRGIFNQDPGGEFLNWNFAIVPTVADVQSLNYALENYERIVAQYLRDADRLVRRKTRPYDLPEEVTSSVVMTVPSTSKGRAVTINLASGSPICTITKRINRKVWYAGAFKYHVPKDVSDFELTLLKFMRVFGIAPSPQDVWELLPFSWLADYFTNGGNAIRHFFLQSTEGAAQVYGYVMCESKVETTYVWRGTLRINNVDTPSSITAVVRKTIKQRVRVSPFGVHFTGLSLTPKQLAILASLGIAK
jgi:hypothetical protein